ncbi:MULTISPECIES: enoyl-CoA hydratase/isomerase family protein [Roseobacteraceae]|uniref:Short-chain-enoyl-CoA hydratase n=1 Tax=Pseudosulfitobacter pseudonitzschiae TaxID=1402135 RepID=A0A221K7L3_9RHOB|nr:MULTISPECIES: enoyl-CoA hydratase-related protein [Roseobacteraceae]ASM75002.1 short-chain-enoyl-CoA hydratase [Pseudosulfitobacter pseudonitzschiae]
MPEYETLIYDRADNGVATITLNRPDRMNTLGGAMKPELYDVFQNVMLNDRGIRCVILTGAGDRAFCAGADIKERAGNRPPRAEYYAKQKFTHDLTCLIETFERPVIAAINGVALGGGLEIALCADIRFAADHAKLGLPEVNLGVLPAAGGTQRLPRLIGAPLAKELMFTGRHIKAEEAMALGIVSRVVPLADLMQGARNLADEIAAKPPLSVAFIKQAVNSGLQVGMLEGLEYERFGAAMIMDSADRTEGMNAFLEKRKPVFRGD